MARAGSDPFVEQVREANDIVELIGARLELKRAGGRFRGLCPFHQEKTPSFFVSREYQTYHCFGCGVGGDVFTFVMEQERMTFPEALQHLAERAGIPMPQRRSGPSQDLLERIRQALRVARSYYRERLLGREGDRGRRYLAAREIGPDLGEEYGLGLAPDAWEGLLTHCRRLLSDRALIEAGLAVEGERGRVYDRFRNRLMFPIDSPGGAPVGFGGRILGDGEPKYLNSPETAAYRKASVLFGIPQARDAIRSRGRVVLVEGYFDVLGLVQGGIREVVGTCGTALTPEQAGLLRRFGATLVLLFDGDEAGMRAALRALPVVTGVVEEIRVAVPPEGLDPDDWIRQAGRDGVEAALDRAASPIAFLEDRMLAGRLTRREATSGAVGLIARLADPISREFWVQEAAGRFGVSERALLEGARAEADAPRSGRAAAPPADRGKAPAWSPLEAACLRAALGHPDRAGEIAEVVETGRPRAEFIGVLRWIEGQAGPETPEPPSASRLVALAREDLPGGGGLTALVVTDAAPPPDPDALLVELRRRGLKHRMARVTEAIRRAEETNDPESLARHLEQKKRLLEERTRLEILPAGEPEGDASEGRAVPVERDGLGAGDLGQ